MIFFFFWSNSFCILYHAIVIYEKIKHFSEESRYCSKNSLIQCAFWTISNFEILSTLQNVWLVKKVGLKHHRSTVIQLHEGLKIVLQFKRIRHGTQHHLYSWGEGGQFSWNAIFFFKLQVRKHVISWIHFLWIINKNS